MILNTGSRTDIPAYFSEWFYNRIKEGYVLVRNPYYPEQILRYELDPDVVDCLIFCTKNPKPMLSRMAEIDKFHQLWFVTITPYEKGIEPYVPPKEEVMESLKQLSDKVGVNCVGWRYDPIFISEKYSLEYHVNTFDRMAQNLSGYVDHCVISFIDLYAKTKRNFPAVRAVNKEEREFVGQQFVKIGRKYGIEIRSCCEGTELEKFGVNIGGCMTQDVVERAVGTSLEIPKKKSAREECNCLLGNDIGVYNTCGHGCIYCYANYDYKSVTQNRKYHDPTSPLLIGKLQESDVVKVAKQERYSNGQLRFDI